MHRFFITGFPRSRTYWFSQYFKGYTGVDCWHEAMNGCLSRGEFHSRMEDHSRNAVVGNSDCGLFMSDFQARWPDAPTVIVDRDIDQVEASLKAIGLYQTRPLLERAQASMATLKGLRVRYNDIDERLEEIHDHLLPMVSYDSFWGVGLGASTLKLDNIKGNPESFRIWESGG